VASAVPAVSVVMRVHNAAPFLHDSVRSVLGQTFEDIELVAVENGSTDGSGDILREFARRDSRLRVFESRRALGLAGSANYGVSRARAQLIAGMDADDVSHPDRLAREVDAIRSDPTIVLVDVLADGIDSSGRRVRPRDRSELLRRSAFPPCSGSSMYRRSAFDRIGGFRAACAPWEDVDFCLRIGEAGRIVVLPDALYSYRYHVDSAWSGQSLRRAAERTDLMRRALAERRAGRDHDHVLERDADEQFDPDALAAAAYAHGALRLWAGAPPRVIGPLLRLGRPRISRAWLRTLTWAAWAHLSPRTLRSFLRAFVRTRDAVAGARLDGGPHEWRFE
jgi:GT2 family glycosyltransferase